MSASVRIRSNGAAGRIAAKLESAARGGLKRDLEGAVRRATAPVPDAYTATLARRMPQEGGYARSLAGRVVVSRRRIEFGYRLTAKSSTFDMPKIERGILRHPLFGNRKHWYVTKVPPGLFAAEIRAVDDDLRREITAAMRRATGG